MKAGVKMSITSRAKKWEILNSLWILFTFTLCFFNWIGFFYISYKVRYIKWSLCGLIYSIPFIIVMIIGKANNLVGILTLILGIIGIVHAFLIRNEYLIRLDAIQHGKILSKSEIDKIILKHNLSKSSLKDYETMETIKSDIDVKHNLSKEEFVKNEYNNSHEKMTDEENTKNKIVDINIASENEIANLPGIGLILAKKAINHRQTKGYFNSIDEFAELLLLKPHIFERIKPLIVVSKIETKHENNSENDKTSTKSGRIVDF
ncbi:helix-hairpin-helix domain-containing protein [Clostridium sp. AWRP]|nr:helix-hairpin-helix domain-containing protein [Clostridium sp. AWRP]